MSFNIGDIVVYSSKDKGHACFNEKIGIVSSIDSYDNSVFVDFGEVIKDHNYGIYTHDSSGLIPKRTGYWFFDDGRTTPKVSSLSLANKEVQFEF